MDKILTTKEVALKLNVSVRRVQSLIHNNQLIATKVGRDYIVKAEDLKTLHISDKAGRPKKVMAQRNTGKIISFADVAGEFIGSIDDLPSDLSTNKKYLEGLGHD